MKTCFLKRNFLKFKFISPNVDGEMVKRQLNLYFSESNHDKASLTGKSQNVQICKSYTNRLREDIFRENAIKVREGFIKKRV